MNFDSKYLIRWGIPGWIFITFLSLLSLANKTIDLESLTKDGIQLLGSILVVLPIGVIVGYLFYQMYFIVLWMVDIFDLRPKRARKVLIEQGYKVPSDKNEAYFFLETKWHQLISKLPADELNYISQRYTHLLRKTHEMGSLFISTAYCLLMGIGSLIFNGAANSATIKTVGLVMISFCFVIYTFKIFRYYSKNADYFMAENLKDIVEKMK